LRFRANSVSWYLAIEEVQSTVSKVDFSIAVCTYNPKYKLIERLLTAIQAILTTTQSAEVLLVDNNSSPALSTIPSVQHFLAQAPQARCVVELKQGLTAARCRAIQEASAPIVVFFDDDNEPSPDYLQVLDRYFSEYPMVGIWGPGHVAVEYVDPVEPWLHQYTESFQQRQVEFGYSCAPATWEPHFPNGTGFAVRREILQQYASAIERGYLQTMGRQGKSLSSAEDVQIVWEGFKLGFAAGMIPELKCNHLITADKANLAYLKRLHFGTASSYLPALLESYPEQAAKLGKPPAVVQVYRQSAKFLLKMALRPQQRLEIQIKFAGNLGEWYGHARAFQSPHAHQLLSLAMLFQLV
jgi:glycosyltransferase involved in cell wall biosynthesis